MPKRRETDVSVRSVSLMSTISGTSFDVDRQSTENFNRLDFFNTTAHGRATEVGQLLGCYLRIKNGASEAIFVHGVSGSGKTKVVETLRDAVADSGGYFVSGKFDQVRMNDPASALVSALTDLNVLLLQSNHRTAAVDRIRQCFNDHEIRSLTRLVYNLAAIMNPHGNGQPIEQKATNEDYNNLVFLFRAFVNAVSTPRHPVVVFLDDFHWADDTAMSVVRSFLDDEASKHVLLICAYRYADECGVDVASVLKLKGSEASKPKLIVRSMKLGNLDLDSMASFIAQLTRVDLTEAKPLAEVVVAKTTGNPHHAVQFLELLVSQQLLFQNENGRWNWNLERIQSETNKTDNVVELVAAKFGHLTKPMQVVLIVASYLGFLFEAAVLQAVLNAQRPVPVSLESVTSTLDAAVREGVLEPSGSLLYKFSHDKIQTVCYNTVSNPEERNTLHYQIGKVTQQMFARDEPREDYCFLAADHLNRIHPDLLDPSEKVDLSELNLTAGSLAMKKGAFNPASIYLRSGIALLDRENMWTDHYELALELHKLSAKALCCIGDIDAVYHALEEICQHAKALSHKGWALYLKVKALTGQGRLAEAVSEGVAAIGLHGEKIQCDSADECEVSHEVVTPWRQKSNEELLKLPAERGQSTEELFNLFAITIISTYLLDEKPGLLTFLSLRFVNLTLAYGWVAQSAMAYAAFGLVLSQTAQYDDAYRFGRLAVDGVALMDPGDCTSGIILLAHNFSLHLREPLKRFSDNYLQGYNVGTKNGDIFLALMCGGEHISSSFHSGMYLREIEHRMATFCSQANELNQQTMLSLYLPYWQMILNIQGESERTTTLTGKAMSESDMWAEAERTNNRKCRQVMRFSKSILFCLFDEIQDEENLFQSIKSSCKSLNAHYTSFIQKFYEALILYNLYLKDRNDKYIALAKEMSFELKEHAEAGNINCAPLADFLAAEEIALSGTKAEIVNAYSSCLRAFRETNVLHYQALANERIGLALLRREDVACAKDFFLEALALYDQWGAQGKVSQLQESYGALFGSDNMSTDSADLV